MGQINEYKVKGLVLTKTSFGENDLIFDLLSESGERMSFFVRGGRKIKSKFLGTLQLGNFVEVTFSKGKNFNYPKEAIIINNLIFDFYSKSIEGMNFFSDIIQICKCVSSDFNSKIIYSQVVKAFVLAQQKKFDEAYVKFLDNILKDLGFETDIADYLNGEIIQDKEFYYHPETNKIFEKQNRPRGIDLLLIKKDLIFKKIYLQRIFSTHVNHYIRLKF